MAKYATGRKALAICDRCGWEYPYAELRPEWNALRVCPTCWDPKHPQLTPRVITESIALRDPRSESSDNPTKVRVLGLVLYSRFTTGAPVAYTASASSGSVYGTGNIGSVPVALATTGVSATGAIGTSTAVAVAVPSGSGATAIVATGNIGEENISLVIEETGVNATGNIGTVTAQVDDPYWGSDTWGAGTWGM